MSDSSRLVNPLPASSPCKVLTLLHFNEKADLGHDLVGFLTSTFQRCACKTELLLTLEVERQSQAHPHSTTGSCLGDVISVGGQGSSLGKEGGKKPTTPAL